MDFTNRGSQPQVSRPGPAPEHSSTPTVGRSDRSRRISGNKWGRVGGVVLLFCLTIIAGAVIGLLILGGNDQSRFVSDKHYQAVFLTNGQVYFGKISEMGSDYFRLNDIYYLTQNSTTDKNGNTTGTGNYTLVKLGCQQIHDPYDEMVIERSQISFWENLQDNGKVVSSIQQFQKQNPNGPDCSQVSSQTQASNTNTQGSSNTNNSSSSNSSTNSSTNNSSNNSNSSTNNSTNNSGTGTGTTKP